MLAKLFDVSSATIRNDMAELESNGFIAQPHTSAGRVPTDKGYRFYVNNMTEQLSTPAERGAETRNHRTRGWRWLKRTCYPKCC